MEPFFQSISLTAQVCRRGGRRGPHEVDRTFRFRRHLDSLRAAGATYRALFWRAWGLLTVLYCFKTDSYFAAEQFENCPAGGCHQVRTRSDAHIRAAIRTVHPFQPCSRC